MHKSKDEVMETSMDVFWNSERTVEDIPSMKWIFYYTKTEAQHTKFGEDD